MSDLTDIVNLASSAVTLLKSNETQSMGSLATALPRGVDPLKTGGNWRRVTNPLVMTITWPALHPTFASDTVISLGVIWTFGGSVDGKGRFIKDAEAYVKVGSVTATYSFDVTAKFAESGTPIGSEPVAMLTGTFNVVRSRTIFGVVDSSVYGFKILGDGSGEMVEL
ncbi:hypothetical protein [Microbacterium xylanilyticum]